MISRQLVKKSSGTNYPKTWHECLYLMLKWAKTGASPSERPSKANFDALYSSWKGVPTIPKWLLLLMMWPLCLAFMLGSTAWINRRAPKKLTSNNSLAMSMGAESRMAPVASPALLTAMTSECTKKRGVVPATNKAKLYGFFNKSMALHSILAVDFNRITDDLLQGTETSFSAPVCRQICGKSEKAAG